VRSRRKKKSTDFSVLISRKEESLRLTVLAATALTATLSGLAAAKLFFIVNV
jgi:hypothetical protein